MPDPLCVTCLISLKISNVSSVSKYHEDWLELGSFLNNHEGQLVSTFCLKTSFNSQKLPHALIASSQLLFSVLIFPETSII